MVDEEKVKAIRDWKRPKTTNELQRFLGLVNYYREFIQDLGKTGRPLYKVKEEETLVWIPKMVAAFEKLREQTTQLPYRVLWDPRKDL
jgi:hypothetical protein